MSVYVIAKKSEKDVLDTVIFHAGETGEQEAVMVFTNEAATQRFLDESNWEEPHQPVALDALSLVEWLMQANSQGVRYLAVDPQRKPQRSEESQIVLSIEAELTRCADSVVSVIAASANSS